MERLILSMLFTLLLTFSGCGGEDSVSPTSSTGRAILAQTSDLTCSLTIAQGETAINDALASTCPLIFGASLRTDEKSWSIGSESTCPFIAINGAKEIIGRPTDSHIGTCKFYLYKRLDGDIEIFLTNLTVTNVAPNLSLTDSVIGEDAGLSVVKADTDIQSSDEGYGVYLLDNAGATAPKCSENGSLSINETSGEVSFNPDLNYNGVCNVRVLFDDENSVDNTVIDEFQVTVTAINDAPVLSNSCATTSIDHDVVYNCNTLVLSDPELTDTQTWSLDASHTCAWMSVNSATGEITGTANDDQVGSCVLAVKSNDGTVDSNIYSENITVLNVVPTLNDLTTVQSITEDDPDTTVLLAADVTSNEEGYGVYSLDNANATEPKCSDNGTVSIDSSTGAVNFTPSANYFGSCIVRVVFDDQNPVDNTVYKESTIIVIGVNDVPVIDSVCATSVNELVAYTCTGAITDVENDTITWSLDSSNTCSWAAIDSGNGNVTGTPIQTDVGSCDLVLKADDGTDTVTKSFTVTVNNVTPVITIADTTLDEDSAATEIRADGDVSSTDEDYGTYSLVSASSNDCSTHGTTAIDSSTGAITYTPTADYDQACNIKVQFDDGHSSNNIGTKEFVVTMNPIPDNAVVSLPAACDTDVDEDVTYTCTPIITDVDTGDTHTWSIDNNTCAFISSVVPATGVMSGTAHDDQVGTCTFTIKATGDQDSLVSSTLTANFSVINVKPILSVTTPININQRFDAVPTEYAASAKNTDSTIDVTSTDETHGTFSLGTASSDDCAGNMTTYTLDTATGVLTLYPNDMYFGTCNVAIDFDDVNSTDNVADTLEFAVTFVDAIPPLITYVDSSTPDGTYYIESDINITVKFNEAVNINVDAGVPRIFLETGAVDRSANYAGISGDQTEVYFNYTVQEDDQSSDLAVHSSVTYLDLAGSTFEDLSGNTLANYPLPLPATDLANSLSGRRDIVVDGRLAELDVTGLPSRVSPDLVMNATVSGPSVAEYQYKVTQVGAANDTCDDSTGYSSNIDVSVKITDDLIPYALGSEIRLCIVGVTSDGTVTPYDQAFEYIWSKDDKSFARIDFTGVTNLPNWQDAEIDPDNPNIIYARNLLGVIYKSDDYGDTWENYCNVPQIYDTNLEVSQGPDRTAYVIQDGKMYKISNKLGGSCENITANGSFTIAETHYGNNSVSITNTGDIYAATASFGSPKKIYRSFDQGSSWYEYLTMPLASNGSDRHESSVNPHNPSKVMYSKYSGTSDTTAGFYLTEDGGATWDYISSLDTGWPVQYPIYWHPLDESIVYIMSYPFKKLSINGGQTFTDTDSGTGYDSEAPQRFAFDYQTGYGYRLRESGSVTLLEVATDITTPGTFSWSTVYSFATTAGTYNSSRSLSVSGNSSNTAEPTIVVNILDRMWISKDGGSTFTEKFAPEELKLMTIAGAGDDHIYGATKDWRVVKTTDNGETWEYKTGDYYHCLGVSPRIQVNQINPSKILLWPDNFANINCANFTYSINGMNSLLGRDDINTDANKVVVSTSVHDENTFYVSGDPTDTDYDFRFYKTFSFGYDSLIKGMSGYGYSDPMPESYIHPHNDQYVWILDNVSTGTLYQYAIEDGTRSNITANSSLTSLAGLDIYTGDKGQFYLRVIDRTGRMQVSSDYGTSFSDEGATGSPLKSCNKRFLYHHPQDRNLVVTSCVLGNTIGVSLDSGNTWDETDLLTDYDLDCKITGIGVSSSRIFIGCRDDDSFIFNYAFLKLQNDIADSVLTSSETSSTDDLVSHYFPGNYSDIKYAVIPDGTTCDGALTFSSNVPTASDIGFTTRGDYRICIEQTDLASNVSYITTTTIFYDNSTPSFISIDLINDAPDGEINLVEYRYDNYLVGNLVSSEHDYVKYSLVDSSTTCDGTLDYSFSIPKSNSSDFHDAGSYKVCVELSTRGGVTPVYGSSATITFVKNIPEAVISGVPVAFISTDSALNVTVSGTGVVNYVYKVNNSADADYNCSDDDGYSSSISVATPITEDLSGFSNGDRLKLCVKGIDSSGYVQSGRYPTLHEWIYSTSKDIYPIDMSSIASEQKYNGWKQVKVHPNNENIIFALNQIGEVWKSSDKGANWNLQCKVTEYRTDMALRVSPGIDNGAVITHSYTSGTTYVYVLWRIFNNDGGTCSNQAGDFREKTYSNYIHSPFAYNQAGHGFAVENQYDQLVLRRSSDEMVSWDYIGHIPQAGQHGTLAINPHNEKIILVSSRGNNSGSGTRGLYRTDDGGQSWSFIQSTGFTDSVGIYFDPAISGRVYSTSGYLSTDAGATWAYDTSLITGTVNWTVANDGAGYKLVHSGSDTILQKSSSMNPISFSSLYTFSGIQSSDVNLDFVSVAGNTITALVGEKRLFISTDGGSNFTEQFWPGDRMQLLGLDATHGGQIYGVTKSQTLFATSDLNSSWTMIFDQWHDTTKENEERVISSPLNRNFATVYYDNGRARGYSTTDGFSSYTGYEVDSNTSENTIILNAKNPNYYAYLDASVPIFYETANSFTSTFNTASTLFKEWGSPRTITSNSSVGYSLKEHPSTYLVIDWQNQLFSSKVTDTAVLYTLLDSRVSGTPAGLGLEVKDNGLSVNHFVVSKNGVLSKSEDDAKTFTVQGTSSPGMISCDERLLYIKPNLPHMMVMGCHEGDELAWSLDGGSSWNIINFSTTYNLSCTLSTVAMTNSEILFNCESGIRPAMKYSFTPVKLLATAADNIINSSEVSGATIAEIDYPGNWVSIQYAIITDGGDCSGTTTGFSSSPPLDTDLTAYGSGSYQICAALNDGSTTTYNTSTTVTYLATSPSFTSIDLVNDATDGVSYADHIEASSDLVGNLSASNYTTAYYALVGDAVTCDATLNYTTSSPKTNSEKFDEAGDYKVCVGLSDGVNDPVFGQSATFAYSKETRLATLSGLPDKISNETTLNISVGGTDISHYQYKVGVAPQDCGDSTGYSSQIPIGTLITDDISGLADGSINLCVRGIDSTNHYDQLLSKATSYTWTKADVKISSAKFNIAGFSANWFDVEVSKWDSGIPYIFARDFDGNIFISKDRGSSFELACKLPHDANSRMMIAPVKAKGAFATSGTKLYRIDELNGESCQSISDSFTSVVSTWQRAPIAFRNNGDIYAIDEVNTTQSLLYRSNSLGEDWTLIHTFDEAFTNLSINVDPFNNDNMFLTFLGTSTNYTSKFIMTLDETTSFVGKSFYSSGPTVSMVKNVEIDFKYDPVNEGYVYSNNGYYSNGDFMHDMNDGIGTYVDDYSRWDIDKLGVGYRLIQNGADLEIHSAPDMTTAAFVLLDTFSSITADIYNRTVSVSYDGSTKAVIANGTMYISLDSSAFTAKYTPIFEHKISSVSAEDNSVMYAVDSLWRFLKSTDGGANWSFVNVYASGCSKLPRIRTNKSSNDHVYVWAEDKATGSCLTNVVSTDGLSTYSNPSFSLSDTIDLVHLLDPANAGVASYQGATNIISTNNSFSSTTTTVANSVSVDDHGYDGFISKDDNNLMYYPVGGALIEVDLLGASKTDITSSLTMGTAAGVDALADGRVYVISNTGAIDISTNSGVSYSSQSSNTSLTSCSSRMLKTSASEAGVVFASACENSTLVAFSLDSGSTWSEYNLASYTYTSSCVIRDIAITGTSGNYKLYLACKSDKAMILKME